MPEQTEPALIPGFKKCAGEFFFPRRALLGRGVTGGGVGGGGGGVCAVEKAIIKPPATEPDASVVFEHQRGQHEVFGKGNSHSHWRIFWQQH